MIEEENRIVISGCCHSALAVSSKSVHCQLGAFFLSGYFICTENLGKCAFRHHDGFSSSYFAICRTEIFMYFPAEWILQLRIWESTSVQRISGGRSAGDRQGRRQPVRFFLD